MKIDNKYNELYQKALIGYKNAYAPYSKFFVGASLLLKDNNIIYGCNVENASYGLTNCAERSCLFSAISCGYKKEDIVAILIVGDTKGPIMPCGACRQVIVELMDANCEVICCNLCGDYEVYQVKDLLPNRFNEDNLNG